ncbi:MAG TPA: DinB family protein, partial [Acidimicrobiales bacterium]|nr:DinB family protein [Acidimicrobiales bacterium]
MGDSTESRAAESPKKDPLRRLIEAARAKEREDLIPLVSDAEPAAPGRWTAKDNLAHLSSWRLLGVAELDAIRTGEPAPPVSDDVDEHNAGVYEATRDLPADEVIAAASESWDELAEALDACSEEDLLLPRLRHPDSPAWQLVAGHTYFHVGDHLGTVLTEQGHEDAAERLAYWAHGQATGAFPEDRRRGVADYNLACFYAKNGRAAEALPYLASAFRLLPSLRELA